MHRPPEHLTCQEVVALVTDYLEGTLPPGQAAPFEQHLNFCEGCVHYLDQLRMTVDRVGRVREDDLPAEARDRLVAAFREWRRS